VNEAFRSYEASFDFPGRLAAARARPDYERSYDAGPLVSVVLPTYNRAELLCERGLASVLRQSYERLDVIVVGNACTDDTVERVNALGDPRVRVVNLAYQAPGPEDDVRRWHNSGTAPINHGFALAAGAWIAVQHDDDEWDDDYLERVLGAAQRAHAEVAYCRARAVHGETGQALPFEVGAYPPVLGQFGTQFAVFHQALRLFGYDPACAWIGEPNDWNFARRMLDAGVRFEFVPEALATYHMTPRTEGSRGWLEAQLREG
jgi:glycosyltransferase involved in cell wall biosynthesis